MKILGQLSALSLLCIPLLSHAGKLDAAAAIEHQTLQAAANSQQRVSRSDDASQKLKVDIEQLEAEVANLKTYRDHLKKLIASQEDERASLSAQIADIAQTRKGLIPLMYDMLTALDVWVDEDLPFNQQVRQHRVDALNALIARADVSDAEKLRRILEAYQIEIDYGDKLGVYREKLLLDGKARDVDVLHLGRLSLVAKSLQGDRYWYFDKPRGAWLTLDNADVSALDKAYDVAAETSPPQLLSLPLSVSSSSGEVR